MSAILAGTSTLADLTSTGGSSFSGSITVPASCTRLMVAPLLHAGSLVTVSAMTFNAIALTQIANTRGTNTTNGGDSAEWWTLASPATGAHTFAATLSASARGGFLILFMVGDTGVGAVGFSQTNSVGLSAVADQSLILLAVLVEDDTNVVASGPFQNSTQNVKLSDGAGANSVLGLSSTMRGYPGDPRWIVANGTVGVASAVEIQGAADVIVPTTTSLPGGWFQWRRMHPRRLGPRL